MSPAPWQEALRRLRDDVPRWVGKQLPDVAELAETFGTDADGMLHALASLVAEGSVRRTVAGGHFGVPVPDMDPDVAVQDVEPVQPSGGWLVRWQDARRRGGELVVDTSFSFDATCIVVARPDPAGAPSIRLVIDGGELPPVMVAVRRGAERNVLHRAGLAHHQLHPLARCVRVGDRAALALALGVIGADALAALGER